MNVKCCACCISAQNAWRATGLNRCIRTQSFRTSHAITCKLAEDETARHSCSECLAEASPATCSAAEASTPPITLDLKLVSLSHRVPRPLRVCSAPPATRHMISSLTQTRVQPLHRDAAVGCALQLRAARTCRICRCEAASTGSAVSNTTKLGRPGAHISVVFILSVM